MDIFLWNLFQKNFWFSLNKSVKSSCSYKILLQPLTFSFKSYCFWLADMYVILLVEANPNRVARTTDPTVKVLLLLAVAVILKVAQPYYIYIKVSRKKGHYSAASIRVKCPYVFLVKDTITRGGRPGHSKTVDEMTTESMCSPAFYNKERNLGWNWF